MGLSKCYTAIPRRERFVLSSFFVKGKEGSEEERWKLWARVGEEGGDRREGAGGGQLSVHFNRTSFHEH